MALSNWDTLAFDDEGKSCRAEFSVKDGVTIEIYKNWANVRFGENNHFTFNEGNVSVNGLEIFGKRGPQQAIFLFAKHNDWDGEKTTHQYFAAIGCNGFMSNLDWLKIHQPEIYNSIPQQYFDEDKYLICSGSSHGPDGESWGFYCYPENSNEEPYSMEFEGKGPGIEELWTGVTKETYQEFINWLTSLFNPRYDKSEIEWLEKVKQASPIRYNQGDAYFADNLEQEIPGTELEKCETPMINDVIKSIFGEDK